jgi:hypothetical protein
MNFKNNSYWLVVCVIIALGLVALLLGGCGNIETCLQQVVNRAQDVGDQWFGGVKGTSPSDGVISEVTMATAVDQNDRPLNPTSVFATDADGFYCSFKLSGFPVGSKVRAEWIYVGGDPEVEAEIGQDYVMETQTGTIMEEGHGYTAAAYNRPPIADYRWPKGNYKVVVYVDDQEKGSASFKVE